MFRKRLSTHNSAAELSPLRATTQCYRPKLQGEVSTWDGWNERRVLEVYERCLVSITVRSVEHDWCRCQRSRLSNLTVWACCASDHTDADGRRRTAANIYRLNPCMQCSGRRTRNPALQWAASARQYFPIFQWQILANIALASVEDTLFCELLTRCT